VWLEILLWLQGEPEAMAKALLDRWPGKDPHQDPAGQLRTLQRRGRAGRRVMAWEVVYGRRAGEDGEDKSVIKGHDEVT
jgi:hypothetical protein